MIGQDAGCGQAGCLVDQIDGDLLLRGGDFDDKLAGVIEIFGGVCDEGAKDIGAGGSGAQGVGGFIIADIGQDLLPFGVGDVGGIGDEAVGADAR